MARERSLSVHPKFAAFLDLVVGSVMGWWIGTISSWQVALVWFAIRMLWWGALITIVFFPAFVSRVRHLVALGIFAFGALFFVFFVETDVRPLWYFIQLVTIGAPAISFWMMPHRTHDLTVMAKPYRRWKLFMMVWGVAGTWVGVKALEMFQVLQGRLLIGALFGAVVGTALVSWWAWYEYGAERGYKWYVATGVMALVLAELVYAVKLWPAGYMVTSFFLTWVWYVVWLLLRFFLSDEGVDLRRQRVFLLSNGLFLLLFLLFIVRWK